MNRLRLAGAAHTMSTFKFTILFLIAALVPQQV